MKSLNICECKFGLNMHRFQHNLDNSPSFDLKLNIQFSTQDKMYYYYQMKTYYQLILATILSNELKSTGQFLTTCVHMTSIDFNKNITEF